MSQPTVSTSDLRYDLLASSGSPMRVNDAARARVCDLLSAHFADGSLDHAEFDRRLDLAQRAVYGHDLVGLLRDLPTQAPAPVPRIPTPAAPPVPDPTPAPMAVVGQTIIIIVSVCALVCLLGLFAVAGSQDGMFTVAFLAMVGTAVGVGGPVAVMWYHDKAKIRRLEQTNAALTRHLTLR